MSTNIIKSISGSVLFKIASSGISFITVPILLKSLGTSDYSIWVTLTSLISWLSLFDFGSGFSLKNKIAQTSVTKDNINHLIAGTIQFYCVAAALIMLVFLASLSFVSVFKDHTLLACLLYVPTIVAFPFTLGNFVLEGTKKFNLLYLLQFSNTLLWFILVVLFRYKVFPISLINLCLAYSLLFFTMGVILFSSSIGILKFNLKQVLNFSHFKSSGATLMTGMKFFVLQISALIMFSLGNILVYRNLPLQNVSKYDTINKIFVMGLTLFYIVISVYWTEISQAIARKDKQKLLTIYKQLILTSTTFCIIIAAFSLFMPQLISIWTKGIILVRYSDILPFVLLIFVQVFACAGGVFLNAFEDLKGQIILAIATSILFLPVATWGFHLNLGLKTVPIVSSMLALPTAVYVLIKGRRSIVNMTDYEEINKKAAILQKI